MAMKFALLAALCISQGFAFKPLFRGEKEPCKHPLPESAEIIHHEFEETMNEMDDFRETVSAAMMEAYFKGNDPKVVIACFNQQSGNYIKLGLNVANKIRAASVEIGKELGGKYIDYATRAAEPFRKLADTLRTFPEKMSEYINNQQFLKAIKLYIESKKIIEENARILADLTREFTSDLPETAEKAEKLAQEIREEARNGCEEIGNAFRQCVEQGGPKKAQLEESE